MYWAVLYQKIKISNKNCSCPYENDTPQFCPVTLTHVIIPCQQTVEYLCKNLVSNKIAIKNFLPGSTKIKNKHYLCTVMRVDCGETQTDSVSPSTVFSFATYLRNNSTLSSWGMTCGIFWRSTCYNVNVIPWNHAFLYSLLIHVNVLEDPSG